MFANLKGSSHRAEQLRNRPESAFKRLGLTESDDDDEDDDDDDDDILDDEKDENSSPHRRSFDLEPAVPDYLKIPPRDSSSSTKTKQTKLDFFKSFNKLLPAEDDVDDDDDNNEEESEDEEDGEEEDQGKDEYDQGDWIANKEQDDNYYDAAGILPAESVASPPSSVAHRARTTTSSSLIEQFTRPLKGKQRARQRSAASEESSSERTMAARKGRRKDRADKESAAKSFETGYTSPRITSAGFSIPASPVVRLPERTKAQSKTVPRKRTHPNEGLGPARQTKLLKSNYSIEIVPRPSASHHTPGPKAQPQSKQKAAARTSGSKKPTGFQILSKEKVLQTSKPSKPPRDPASAVTTARTTLSQSPAASPFYIDPRPLFASQRRLQPPPPQPPFPPSRPPQRKQPPKRPKLKKQPHPQSRLPYHGPTNDFMVLVSPRQLPKHNGSSTFFKVLDEERYTKAAQYPMSREVDRKQAALERAKYPVLFAPPITSTGPEVT